MEWEKALPKLSACIHHAKQGFKKLDGSHKLMASTADLDLVKIAKECLTTNPKTMWIICMDERIQYFASSHRALSIGLPGCECLVSGSEKDSIIQQLIAVCEDLDSLEEIIVTSHSSCGAVNKALCSKKNIVESQVQRVLSQNSHYCDQVAKSYSVSFAKELATRADTANLDLNIRTLHLDHEQLHCPSFHNAVGAVINYIPNLNVSEFEEKLDLPLFNIYALGQSAKLIQQNIELAISIASQSYGSNGFFTDEKPFSLIFAGRNREISEIIKNLSKSKISIPVAYTICDL